MSDAVGDADILRPVLLTGGGMPTADHSCHSLAIDICAEKICFAMGADAPNPVHTLPRRKVCKSRRGRPLDPLPGRAERQTRLGLQDVYRRLLNGAKNHPGALPTLPNYA